MPIRRFERSNKCSRKKLKLKYIRRVNSGVQNHGDPFSCYYVFDHELCPRTEAGELNRDYFSFSLIKNRIHLVVDINRFGALVPSADEKGAWARCEYKAYLFAETGLQENSFVWALKKSNRLSTYYLCIFLHQDVVYGHSVQEEILKFSRKVFSNVCAIEHNSRSATKLETSVLPILQKVINE